MLDIKLIREQPDKIKQGIEKKGTDPVLIDKVLELDKQKRSLLQEIETIRAKKNATEKKLIEEKDKEKIIQILKEELDYAVRKNIKNSKHWNEETLPEYVLDSQYIIGSIDIDNLELTLNENYLLAADLDFESQHKLY